MSKLNQSFANHYVGIAGLLEEQAKLLESDSKHREARDVMNEGARCLKECAARLEKED